MTAENHDDASRLNILALSYLFPNPAQPAYGIFVLNRLKAVREFCNVRVIAPIQWYPLISRLRGAFSAEGVAFRADIGEMEVYHPRFPVIPRYFKWIDAITYWLSIRAAMRKLGASAFDFDLVDVHWTYPDIVSGYLLARKRRKKFIVTVRGHEALYENERSLRRWLLVRFLRRADFIVALSNELRDKLVSIGVAPEKTRVVLNGVDLAHFHPRDRATCRQKLGLPMDSKIILSVGRVTEGKGHQDIVRILPELSKTVKTELYIIGGVNPEDDFTRILQAQIAGLGLKNVHLMDKVPHETLPLWYGAADLFCLATRREGCPNVLLESLACGTPVVVTDVGAVGEMVVQGENGFRVRLDEMSSFGEVVRQSLEHRWDRQKIAAGMNGWGWSACAERVLAVYRTVLGRN
jgi:glycosyltransferase involved in cell wall biosynthesis